MVKITIRTNESSTYISAYIQQSSNNIRDAVQGALDEMKQVAFHCLQLTS
jgi:hypothetical protein